MRLTLLCPLLLLALPAAADNIEAEARSRMKLSFDYDQVQEMLEAPAPAAAAPRAYDGRASVPQAPLPLEPNSTVDTVTIFGDRALVTRVRTVSVSAGASEVVFEGLPLGIAADSLHAELRKGEARIVGVERSSGQGKVADSEHTSALREQAQGLTRSLGEVQDRIAALLAQREFLRATLLKGGENQPQPTAAQIRANLDYVGQTEADIAGKLRQEEQKAADLDEKLSPLLTKLQDPQATGATVKVDVETNAATSIVVALSYQVFGAGWSPAYNARLDPASNKVEIDYFGIVSQSTGEIWKDAALFLSTGNPSISGDLPTLTPWYLGRGGGAFYELEEGGGHLDDMDNVQRAAAPLPQAAAGGGLSTAQPSGGAVVFAIPGRRTLAGDGSEQRLPVGVQSFPSTLEFASTPKRVPEVYRRARLRYAGDAPLLPGVLSTFAGADFVGTGSLETVTPGEELVLSFGTDDHFKVSRQLVSRTVEHPGVGRKTARYTFYYKLTVSNFNEAARTVTVTDQLPVSESDRVVVKLLETTPPRPPEDSDPPGILRWTLNIPAKKEAVIDLRFSVTGPADEGTEQGFRELDMAY